MNVTRGRCEVLWMSVPSVKKTGKEYTDDSSNKQKKQAIRLLSVNAISSRGEGIMLSKC